MFSATLLTLTGMLALASIVVALRPMGRDNPFFC